MCGTGKCSRKPSASKVVSVKHIFSAASSDNLARLWCVETGEIKREYSGHQKAVVCLAFNDSVLG